MNYEPRNVLITGGAGFIGSNHVRWLLANDPVVKIINLDALTYAGSKDNLQSLSDPSRHKFVQGDICDRELIDHLLRDHKIDTIIHYAAESHVDRSISGPAAFLKTNVVGTFTLLEAARDFWLHETNSPNNYRFHHISTDEVYGSLNPNDPPFKETTCYSPRSPYSASKASSDHFVQAYNHTYGLPITISNCSNNYGPYQHPEKFIPTVIRNSLAGSQIPVYGDGSNVRDWLYVDDHCLAVDKIIRHGQIGETYNIGGNNEWANLDIAKTICAILDELRPKETSYTDQIAFVNDRPGHDWRYAIDVHKITNDLGWQPHVDFEHGIRKTIEWYLSYTPSTSR